MPQKWGRTLYVGISKGSQQADGGPDCERVQLRCFLLACTPHIAQKRVLVQLAEIVSMMLHNGAGSIDWIM